MGNKPKHRLSVKGLALFAAAVLIYCVYVGVLFLINANYNEIDATPRITRGVADYADADSEGRLTAQTLSGEWEFFYNRWIITDEDNGENDGFLSIPGRWTNKTVDGEKLTRFGYASYRLTIKNMAAGHLVTCFSDNSVVALRMFVNGKLCSVSGEAAKDAEHSVSGNAERVDYVISDGGDVTIVIETGYTSVGGLTHAPCLSHKMTSSNYWIFIERFVVVMLGLVAGAFLAALIMSLAFKRYDGDFTLPALIGILCLHFFFSKDVTKAIGLYGYGGIWIPALITGILTVAVFAVFILKISGNLNKRILLPFSAVYALCAVAYGVLYGTVYTVIPALIFLTASLFPLYFLFTAKKVNIRFKTAYALIYFLTVCILTFEVTDGAGLLAFGMEYFFTTALAVLIFAQCAVAFLQLYNHSKKLIRMNELENEVEQTRLRAMIAQIKPHFIFNSLNAIRAQYHKDLEEGDAALQNFACHLRATVSAADGEDLIAFDNEVQNIMNYFDLENLRADGALNLLLDLNERDFFVPALSIQPFVENAVKYADTQSAKDGYIRLSSNRTNNGITVVIADNGKGFDTASPCNGVGMKNSRERLQRLLGAEVQIESQPDKGTKVTVIIPVKEQKIENYNA